MEMKQKKVYARCSEPKRVQDSGVRESVMELPMIVNMNGHNKVIHELMTYLLPQPSILCLGNII